jgi:hypothetical protein
LEAPQNVSKALAGPSGAMDHQIDPPAQLGAVSRPSELTDGRYGHKSQIEQ